MEQVGHARRCQCHITLEDTSFTPYSQFGNLEDPIRRVCSLSVSPQQTPTCPSENGGRTVSYLPIQEAVEYSYHKALQREHKQL